MASSERAIAPSPVAWRAADVDGGAARCRMRPAGTRPPTTGRSSSSTATRSASATRVGRAGRDRGGAAATAAASAGSRWCWWPHDWRHRGLATRLLDDAASTRAAGAGTSRRCSTRRRPAPPVYRRLGFRAGFAFERWQGDAASTPSRTDGASPARARRRLGATSTRSPRSTARRSASTAAPAAGLPRRAATRAPGSPPTAAASSIARAGRRATQLGPLVAARRGTARSHCSSAGAAARVAGPVFVDVPERWPALGDLARGSAASCASGRYVRMALGSAAALAAGDRMLRARRSRVRLMP